MRRQFQSTTIGVLILAWFISEAFLPVVVSAYVDPGTTGMLSQVLYVLFYGALGLGFYFLRNIKQYLASAVQFLTKMFGGKP